MKIREGVRLKWVTVNGQRNEAVVKKITRYAESNAYGRMIEFVGDTGFRSIPLDWVTHINRQKVQRKK